MSEPTPETLMQALNTALDNFYRLVQSGHRPPVYLRKLACGSVDIYGHVFDVALVVERRPQRKDHDYDVS